MTAALISLLAVQTPVWVGLALATVALWAVAIWALAVLYFAAFDGGDDDIADVQRFIDLTEEARALIPPGLPLFDVEKAAVTTTAIDRFLAKKEEARAALWESRDRRRAEAAAVERAAISVIASAEVRPRSRRLTTSADLHRTPREIGVRPDGLESIHSQPAEVRR
jgi:FAD/FMN-containing dehydrogenase